KFDHRSAILPPLRQSQSVQRPDVPGLRPDDQGVDLQLPDAVPVIQITLANAGDYGGHLVQVDRLFAPVSPEHIGAFELAELLGDVVCGHRNAHGYEIFHHFHEDPAASDDQDRAPYRVVADADNELMVEFDHLL